ncbi:MAG: ATP-dependent DNA helicase RecG, partial [Anaerococcus sp.]|nr:ATP-dependent DNA helicase RecG [Anaerococcus sp.]
MKLIDLKGIGPKKEELLNKLGIYTVSDLYNYYPTSFEDRTHRMIVSKANPDIKYYFEWEIVSKSYQVQTKNGMITYLYAFEKDSNQKIKILWFNDRFSHQKLSMSNTYKFYTKINKNKEVYEAVNPIFCKKDESIIGNIIAIYSLTSGINQKQISDFIEKALENYDSKEEIFDKELLEKFSQSSKYDNLKEVHFPKDRK